MKKLGTKDIKVLIVFNGVVENGAEKDPDFISEAEVRKMATFVYDAAVAEGYAAMAMPIFDICRDIPKIMDLNPDILINLCEGYRGNSQDEMNIAGLWELLGLPYTGNTPSTLALAQDKTAAKAIFTANNIPTPPYEVFSSVPKNTCLEFPVIAKPAREDASLGINADSVLKNIGQLRKKTAELLEKYKQPVLVEKFIQGREFNVAILGNYPPRVLPVSEIDFSRLGAEDAHVTSYEAKWMEDHPLYKGTPSKCPADISSETEKALGDIALRVFRALNGKDYGRVDMRMDDEGNIFVLEYNPNPDISLESGYCKALKAAGISFGDFIGRLINENLNGTENENKKNVA